MSKDIKKISHIQKNVKELFGNLKKSVYLCNVEIIKRLTNLNTDGFFK